MNSYLSVRYVLAAVAIVALLVQAPFYFAAGLAAPGWAVVLLILVWVTLVALGFAWFRRRPWWVVPLPFLAAAIWFGVMSAGEAFLGWTA